MITICKLNWNSVFRDWEAAPPSRKRRRKQSTGVTSCALLASLLMPCAAQSAVGPQVGNDAHDHSSREVFFSDLRSEKRSWSDRVTFKRPKVLFGSQPVIVSNGMTTLDDHAFHNVHVVGDSLSRMIIRGSHAARPLVMHDNDLRGEVVVEAGALQVDDDSIAAELITVKSGAQLIGNGSAAAQYGAKRQQAHHILIEHGGSLQVGTLGGSHNENGIKNFVVKGNLSNGGDVWIHNLTSGVGDTLYVQGDYHGEKGSVVHMEIAERSPLMKWLGRPMLHDKLVIMGNSSGESRVSVINLGGGGAAIDYSSGLIKLISVGGNSDAEFTLTGRAVAGSYEYRLVRGDDRDTASKNWYLVSDASSSPTNDESGGELSRPGGRTPGSSEESELSAKDLMAHAGDSSELGPDTMHGYTIKAPLATRIKVIRPEAGSYNSNAMAANTMFQMNLNDRLSSYYQGEGHGHHGSVWVRYNGSRDRFNAGGGQLRVRGDKNIVTLGIDMLASSTNLLDQFTLGVMGGYGHYRGHTASRVSGYSSHGRVDGHSVGIYGTYQQNADTQTGIYLDSWVLWNRFHNKVSGDDLPSEKYNSKGVTASAELGYNAKIAERDNVKYVLQPHAQIIYQNVRSDNLREANGTRVNFHNRGRTQTVLGVRAAAHVSSGLTSTITPHLEVNWLHSDKNYAVRMNGVGAEMGGGRNAGQLKLGVEGEINQRVSLDVALFRNQGNSGYHETGGNLALKYRY